MVILHPTMYREVRRDDLTSIPPTYNLESRYFGAEYICTHTCNFAFFRPNFSPELVKDKHCCTAHAWRCKCHWLQMSSGKFCLKGMPFQREIFKRCLMRGLAAFLFCSKRPWPRCLSLEASWLCPSGKSHPARCLAWRCPLECLKGDGLPPMVLPGMFSRKNRKSWEQFVGGIMLIQVWDVRRGRLC